MLECLRLASRWVGRTLVLCWAVLTITFVLARAAPGGTRGEFWHDPDEAQRIVLEERQSGGDRPWPEAYLLTFTRLASGDLGISSAHGGRPIADLIAESLPVTLQVGGLALLLAFAGGTAVGVLQAVRRGGWFDRIAGAGALTLYSVPRFASAFAVLLVFACLLRWTEIVPSSPEARREHLGLAALALAVPWAALVARHARASMAAALDGEPVRAARALGLSERTVVLRYALRDALGPVLVLLGLCLPVLFSGSLVVEKVFALPGMGSLFLTAARHSPADLSLLAALFLVYTLLVASGNLLAGLGSQALGRGVRA